MNTGGLGGSKKRAIKGVLSLQLQHDGLALTVTVLRCEGLEPRVGPGGKKHCPRAYVRICVLPRNRLVALLVYLLLFAIITEVIRTFN